MDVYEVEPHSYRRNHLNLGEVAQTSYEVAKIKDFGVKNNNPLKLDGTCTIELEGGGTVGGVDIFYHCKKGLYIDQDPDQEDNGSLKHGAMAFKPDKEVKVLLVNNRPECVIAHADRKTRPCVNFFKIKFRGWEGQWHEVIYDYENVAEVSSPSQDLKLTHKGERIMGSREIQFATTMYYNGDFMFHLGPLLFVLCVRSVGMPAPITIGTILYAAPYSKELEDSTRAIGKERDKKLSALSLFSPVPTEIGYPGFTVQDNFTALFHKRYQGYRVPSPRWIFTEIYIQDFFGD